jgi:hypothetical protein
MPADSLEGKFTSATEARGIFVPQYHGSRALRFSGTFLKVDPVLPDDKLGGN